MVWHPASHQKFAQRHLALVYGWKEQHTPGGKIIVELANRLLAVVNELGEASRLHMTINTSMSRLLNQRERLKTLVREMAREGAQSVTAESEIRKICESPNELVWRCVPARSAQHQAQSKDE